MWRVWERRGWCIGSWWGNRREINHWGDLGVDRWIILGRIGLAQDRYRWRTVVSAVMRWAGHVARMGEERGVYRVLVGKPEGKKPLGRPRRRWVDNIRMNLQEVGCGYMDWIDLAQDRAT